jgi:hypothetical protein
VVSPLSVFKVVTSLPGTLEPNAMYFVRRGLGFDLYVADMTGTVAHRVNGEDRNVLPSAVTINSTSYQDVTGLSFPVVAGGNYRFKFFIPYTISDGASGTRWSINGPSYAGGGWLHYRTVLTLSQTAATIFGGPAGYDAPATANATSVVGASLATIEGQILATAGGNVIARGACELGTATITVRPGASVEWLRVA